MITMDNLNKMKLYSKEYNHLLATIQNLKEHDSCVDDKQKVYWDEEKKEWAYNYIGEFKFLSSCNSLDTVLKRLQMKGFKVIKTSNNVIIVELGENKHCRVAIASYDRLDDTFLVQLIDKRFNDVSTILKTKDIEEITERLYLYSTLLRIENTLELVESDSYEIVKAHFENGNCVHTLISKEKINNTVKSNCFQ